MTEDILELARKYLPSYLTPADKAELFSELDRFPDTSNYYIQPSSVDGLPELMQGDGWEGFVKIDFNSGGRRNVKGLVLSNTCDIVPENPRTLPARLLFAPLLSVESYAERLRDAGRPEESILDNLSTIRSQKVSNIFFLPAGQYGPPEAMALLDDIHMHPRGDFLDLERGLLFRLNQVGFHILVIKISIHFCRVFEDVYRGI